MGLDISKIPLLALSSAVEQSKWDHNGHRYLQTLRERGFIKAEKRRVKEGLDQLLQIISCSLDPIYDSERQRKWLQPFWRVGMKKEPYSKVVIQGD